MIKSLVAVSPDSVEQNADTVRNYILQRWYALCLFYEPHRT